MAGALGVRRYEGRKPRAAAKLVEGTDHSNKPGVNTNLLLRNTPRVVILYFMNVTLLDLGGRPRSAILYTESEICAHNA